MHDTTRHSPLPAHWERITIAWLEGLVGGRAALVALTDTSPPAAPPPTVGDPDEGAAYDAVATQVDRLAELFCDDEVAAVLDWSLSALWSRRPSAFSLPTRGRAPTVAGGLAWVVGKANGLFDGDLRQVDVQRVLGPGSRPLRAMGLRLAPVVGRCSPIVVPRPMDASDLTGFGEPALLTPTTRREVVSWRDRALGVEGVA